MKLLFKDLTIRQKIFISTIALIALLTIFSAAFISRSEKNNILEEAKERSLGLCEILAYVSINAIVKNNLLELQGMVETIYRRNEVKNVSIIDTQGKILVSAQVDDITTQWKQFDAIPKALTIDSYDPQFLMSEEAAELTTVIPVITLEEITGYAIVTLNLEPSFKRINSTQHIILLTGFGILVISLIFLYFLSSRITKPLRDLTHLAREYGRGNFELRSRYLSHDEAGELAKEFNQMASNIANLENELIHREKLAALGTTASAIAHELKTPLTSLKNFIQKLPEKIHDEKFMKTFQEIITSEFNRLNKLVNDLLTFSKKETLQKQHTSLQTLINDALTLLRDKFDTSGITVRTDIQLDGTIYADAQKLFRVLINLLDNAISAINGNGLITIKAFLVPTDNGYIQLEFSDNGCGISPENQGKIFEPFFSTKSKGTGLGLAISKHIITLHHGSIVVQSQRGAGTTFIITLPAAEGV